VLMPSAEFTAHVQYPFHLNSPCARHSDTNYRSNGTLASFCAVVVYMCFTPLLQPFQSLALQIVQIQEQWSNSLGSLPSQPIPSRPPYCSPTSPPPTPGYKTSQSSKIYIHNPNGTSHTHNPCRWPQSTRLQPRLILNRARPPLTDHPRASHPLHFTIQPLRLPPHSQLRPTTDPPHQEVIPDRRILDRYLISVQCFDRTSSWRRAIKLNTDDDDQPHFQRSL
jgi:hypothetical protein